MYKTYIISLAESGTDVHQKSAQKILPTTIESCRKNNWTIEIFDAINGYALTQDIWDQLNLKSPKKKNNSVGKFEDKPGAHGCFLSHYILWNRCVSLNEPIIILEDDALVINQLSVIDTKHDLLKLHSPRGEKIHPVFGKWSPMAFAYWLTPIGAKKLINYSIQNKPTYNDKMIGSNILSWDYIKSPIVKLQSRKGSSTNPLKYPYSVGY